MSLILVLLTLAVFITLELVKGSRKAKAIVQAPAKASPFSQIVAGRYFHPGHSWARVDSPEEVTIGVDDFAQKALGSLTKITLPELGSSIRQGDVYSVLMHGDKLIPQVAPVSGIVVRVNDKLTGNPALVNSSSYERGWMVKIAPADLSREVRNLLKGALAERWEEAVRGKLVQWFSPLVHPVMQDGGAIVDNVSDLVDANEWQQFVEEFFPVAMNNRNNNLNKS